MGRTVLLLLLGGVLLAAQTANPVYFMERQPVNGGAELVTLFERVPDPRGEGQEVEVPLVSLLRDTLGDDDPTNDRWRSLWVLTSARPTPIQRAASALSFAWFRAGTRRHENQVPAPALDLAAPAKDVWRKLAADGLQATEFDPLGMAVRASTRSYRSNFSDYRKVQLYQSLSALDGLEKERNGDPLFSDSDLRRVYSRLSLSDRLLGGLVRDQNLSRFYDKETARMQEMRGHNWELLRQRAERSGLYFDPLARQGDTPSAALLWVARADLEQPGGHSFDSQFLGIADPWNDERLQHWTAYSEIRYFDAENRPVQAGTEDARPVELIPLALYSLDHPRVPLLLADFRDNLKPKRRELFRQGASTVVTGVFGITRFGNWPFFAAEYAWTFVRGRHGAAVNRSARLRAYSDTRAFLAVDTRLNPKLKAELEARLDHLALNPLDNDASSEFRLAREQYNTLVQYARSAGGLAAKLERDRRKELDSYNRSRATRLAATLARAVGFSPRLGSKMPEPELIAGIDRHRRLVYHERFLQRLLDSSPRPEVIWDADAIRQSVEALAAEADRSPRIAHLLAQVFAYSGDADLRLACLRGLQRMNGEEARNELRRLYADPDTGDSWRALCLLYLVSGREPVQGGSSGGQ